MRGRRLVLATTANLTDEERDILTKTAALYEETGLRSPNPRELPERLGVSPDIVQRTLQHLFDTGQLVRLSNNVVLSYRHFKEAQDLVVKIIREQGFLDSGEFKLKIHSTRKYALAILDFLDLRHVTIRVQNRRKLAPAYEKNLL